MNYVFIKGTFVDGTCFLKKGINKHFWFLYVVCNNNTYGPECALKCGNCSNGETCHHINGTCFNGCAEGALGDTCQGGSGFGYLSIFKSTQYNHEKLNEIHVNNINNSWDKKKFADCQSGYYGRNCSHRCSENCIVTSQCVHLKMKKNRLFCVHNCKDNHNCYCLITLIKQII